MKDCLDVWVSNKVFLHCWKFAWMSHTPLHTKNQISHKNMKSCVCTLWVWVFSIQTVTHLNEEKVTASDSRKNHPNTKISCVESELHLGVRFKFAQADNCNYRYLYTGLLQTPYRTLGVMWNSLRITAKTDDLQEMYGKCI